MIGYTLIRYLLMPYEYNKTVNPKPNWESEVREKRAEILYKTISRVRVNVMELDRSW